MLTIAMGRLLIATSMDTLQLPMVDMLLSATDMSLLAMDMYMIQLLLADMFLNYGYASTRTLYGGYTSPDSWICLSQLDQQHHELDKKTNTRGKAHCSLDLNYNFMKTEENTFT